MDRKEVRKPSLGKRDCNNCEIFKKIEKINVRISKLPKLATSIDYKLCIDEINDIIHKNTVNFKDNIEETAKGEQNDN